MKYNEFDNPREKTQVRPVTTMTPKELGDRIEKAKAKAFKKPEQPNISQLWAKEKPATEDDGPIMRDPLDSEQAKDMQRDKDRMIFHGKEIDQNSIVYEMQDYSDGIFELHGANYIDGTELDDKELEELESTDELQEWVRIDYVSEDEVQEDAGDFKTAYTQIAQLANDIKQEPQDADDQMDIADEVARPITKILKSIMNYDQGVQLPDAASNTTYVDMYKKLGMLANKGAQTNDPKIADLIFKMMSSIYDMKQVSEDHDGIQSVDVDRIRNQEFTDQQIKQAYRVLNHPSVKGGNYTAAYNIINRIAPGLADHPDVANALKRANEGFIGKKSEYNDFLQNKLDSAIQEYDSPEKKAERDALMQKYLKKGGKIEKVPTGKTAYKDKELKPAYRKDNGTPTTSPMSDESVQEDISEKGRIVLEKAGFDPNAIHEYMAVFNDHGDTTDLEDMNRNKIGVADAMAMVLASHDVENESAVKEDVPFGDGMSLVRRALMSKWITTEEWFHLKDKWKQAAEEIEQRYSDWPDGEGFGSSDHNFAIKELMGLVGYEFDEQDKGGRFIVTKMPEELEKQGIKNVRMQGEPVKAEAGMPASIIKHKQKLAMMSDEELADRFKDFDEDKLRHMAWSHGYGKMSSHYWDRVQAGKKDDHREISRIMKYESKLADMLNQRLK